MSPDFLLPARVPDLEQGSPDWLTFRAGHCNASEAAAALGIGHFAPKTPTELCAQRAGLTKKFTNRAMAYGHENEEGVRARLELIYGTVLVPQIWRRRVRVSFGADWMSWACSLDGIDEDGVIDEIKCPISETSEALLMARRGEIAPYYRAQLHHQMMVTNATRARYTVRDPVLLSEYDRGEPRLYTIEVEPPTDEEQMRLATAWAAIWPHLVAQTVPEARSKREDLAWAAVAEEWLSLHQEVEAKKSRLETLRGELITLAGQADSSIGAGVRVRKSSRVGSVNYKSIPELRGVDLEQYRSKPTTVWTIEPESVK